MPLSFRSENHGNIAFGFFNIESDMLLLENHFFFADRFCQWMGELAEMEALESVPFEQKVHVIDRPEDMGDLMGAIHGIRFTGFIGRTYELFPFPRDPNGFKQNPEGYRTQTIIQKEIERFSTLGSMPLAFQRDGRVWMGAYEFSIPVFHDLIRYVWQGGYPRWKDEIRPGYVREMKDRIMSSGNVFFKGVFAS